MNDVVLIGESPEELQEMLNITKEVADKYHMVFGKATSKVQAISQHPGQFNLGEMEIETTEN
jgi:hypothetical protein